MKTNLVSAFAGVLFAIGLAVSGMTQPAKVIGFLDFTGNWDPSLMLVMAGALGVFGVASRLIQRRGRALSGEALQAPDARRVDGALIGGSALFGVGWGLVGICPGPGVVSLAQLSGGVVAFVGAMAAGQLLFELYQRRHRDASADAAATEREIAACG